MNHEELVRLLKNLQLHESARQYLDLARVAEKKKQTYEQYLFALSEAERDYKHQVKVKRLMAESKIPTPKILDSYDYSDREGVSLQKMKSLAEGDFVKEGSNVVLYGSIGVGKTHLCIGLLTALIQKGYRCWFSSTNKLIESLLEAKKDLKLNAYLRRLDRYDLIACDELGYIPQNQEGADLFFQLISERYERKSLLITTNLTYSDWGKVFLNPTTTAAAVDRIIHRCETLNIKGASWRATEAKRKVS